MIKQSLDYINSKIATLNVFSELLCLCEKISKGETKFPALPSGKEYIPINLDKKDGLIYWRKTGDVTIEKIESSTSCSIDYLFSTPLKAICFVKRTKVDVTEEELIASIIREITTNNAYLKSALNAKKVTILCKSYKTNREELIEEEYSGLKMSIKYEYLYFSIESELQVVTNTNCIPDIC